MADLDEIERVEQDSKYAAVLAERMEKEDEVGKSNVHMC